MSIDPHTASQTRDDILDLLSPEELGSASMAEDSRIPEGDEYLDLEHVELGVQHAEANTSGDHALLRTSVSDATWTKILTVLETPIA